MSNPKATSQRTGLFIGRYFGIRFYLDASWFLIAAIVTYDLAIEYFPAELPGISSGSALALGVTAALIFFLSILLHELGHSLVSQRCGIPVPRITLLFIGGLAEIDREPDDARSELKIALGGPIVSLFLSGGFFVVGWILRKAGLDAGSLLCMWLAQTNLYLVIFNMFPGYPLDGGRVLRALIWAQTGKLRRATFISSRIGIAFGWILIFLGVWLLIGPLHAWNGVGLVLIGFFLKGAAESGYNNAIQRELLGGLLVRDLMTPHPAFIPDSLPLNLAVDEFFLTGHYATYPVCTSDGDFRGLLQLASLKEIPRDQWPYTTAGDAVAKKDSNHLCIGVHQSAAYAMRLLLAPATTRLAVTEGEKLMGIVTRHDLLQFIKIHTELED